MIDIVQIFENAATAAEYEFVYGRKDIQNWQLSEAVDLNAGETVLLVDPFVETAEIDNSIIFKWSVRTTIALGKKFETEIVEEETVITTHSELDETELQKHDRRLQAMRSNMETFIKTIFCNNPLLVLTAAMILREINQFDENIDIIAAEITFNYDS